MVNKQALLRARNYGTSGPEVYVLHGGPAAAGGAAPIAMALSRAFRAIEPFQRGSGNLPLTVHQHVEDLHQLIRSGRGSCKPAIVGESWGAMLALAYAAAYPETVAALVLVGCGTFDKASRAQMNHTIEARKTAQAAARMTGKEAPGIYDYDPLPVDASAHLIEQFDTRAHTESWNSMLEAQDQGTYPAAFTSIKLPALMIHGSYDPHPGKMIHQVLHAYMPHIEYYELTNCGHSPWKERQAREAFFTKLSSWLDLHL